MTFKKIKILLVEDNTGDIRLIQEILKEATTEFEIAICERLSDALDKLGNGRFDVVLLDLNLPDSRKINTFKKVHKHYPHMPIVVLTGIADEELAVRAMREGAQDYLFKGHLESNLLVRLLSYAIERKRSQEALRESEVLHKTLVGALPEAVTMSDLDGNLTFISAQTLKLHGYSDPEELIGKSAFLFISPDEREKAKKSLQKTLKNGVVKNVEYKLMRKDGSYFPGELSAAVVESANGEPKAFIAITRDITGRKRAEEERRENLEKLRKSLVATVNALASAVGKRDPYTAGHQRRVAELTVAIAKEMGLSPDRLDGLSLASVVHDIGKIYIPAEILSKPSKLTNSEYEIVKTHPQVGYEILKTIEFPWPIAEIVLQHHERLDGSGYPQGLKDGKILLEAKIMTVADVVEAMMSHRPYRPAPGMDKALDEISKNRSVLYEPEPVDICIELLTKKGFKFSEN